MLLGPNTLYISHFVPPKPWEECGKLRYGQFYLNPEHYKLKIENHLKFQMFLKSKLVFYKGTCISLDFYFNPRLTENILTLFIFNIIIQARGLFHICIYGIMVKLKNYIDGCLPHPLRGHCVKLILPQVFFQVFSWGVFNQPFELCCTRRHTVLQASFFPALQING